MGELLGEGEEGEKNKGLLLGEGDRDEAELWHGDARGERPRFLITLLITWRTPGLSEQGFFVLFCPFIIQRSSSKDELERSVCEKQNLFILLFFFPFKSGMDGRSRNWGTTSKFVWGIEYTRCSRVPIIFRNECSGADADRLIGRAFLKHSWLLYSILRCKLFPFSSLYLSRPLRQGEGETEWHLYSWPLSAFNEL